MKSFNLVNVQDPVAAHNLPEILRSLSNPQWMGGAGYVRPSVFDAPRAIAPASTTSASGGLLMIAGIGAIVLLLLKRKRGK